MHSLQPLVDNVSFHNTLVRVEKGVGVNMFKRNCLYSLSDESKRRSILLQCRKKNHASTNGFIQAGWPRLQAKGNNVKVVNLASSHPQFISILHERKLGWFPCWIRPHERSKSTARAKWRLKVIFEGSAHEETMIVTASDSDRVVTGHPTFWERTQSSLLLMTNHGLGSVHQESSIKTISLRYVCDCRLLAPLSKSNQITIFVIILPFCCWIHHYFIERLNGLFQN